MSGLSTFGVNGVGMGISRLRDWGRELMPGEVWQSVYPVQDGRWECLLAGGVYRPVQYPV